MKLGFYIIITILLSAVISGILAEESGYISIYYSTYVIEMSLVIFFIINTSFFLFLYFLSKIINTPSLLIIKAQKYKQENANSFIEKSYIKLLQGDYKRAEKYAIKAFSHCDTPLLAYSQAALAADHIDSKNLENISPRGIMHHVMIRPRSGTPPIGAVTVMTSSITHQRRSRNFYKRKA